MSSRAKTMANKMKVEADQVKTKPVVFRFDLKLCGIDTGRPKVFYLAIDNVPEELPEQFKHTVKAQAIKQFEANLNIFKYIKLADKGTSLDEYVQKSKFYNLEQIITLEITDVTEVTEETKTE